MSKSEKTQADASKGKKADAKGEKPELTAEELEAVTGGVVTLANLQGGALTALKQTQMTPIVSVDTGLPDRGGNLL